MVNKAETVLARLQKKKSFLKMVTLLSCFVIGAKYRLRNTLTSVINLLLSIDQKVNPPCHSPL